MSTTISQQNSTRSSITSFTRVGQSLKRVRENVYETLSNINGVELPTKKFTPAMLFATEVIMWLQILLFCSQGIFLVWDDSVSRIIRDFIMPVNTPIVSSYYTFPVFVSALYVSVFFLISTTAIFLYNINSTSEFLNVVCFALLRLTRCVFFFPLMFTLMTGAFCRMTSGDSQVGSHIFFEHSCVRFPGILYAIFGFTMPWYLTILSLLNSAFLSDTHRSVRYLTSTVSSRLTSLTVVVMYLVATVRVIVKLLEADNPSLRLLIFINPLLFLILTILYARMTPYYWKMSNFVFTTFAYLAFVLSLTAGLVEYTRSPISLAALSAVLGLLLIYVFLVVKYAYIYRDMLSGYKRNVFCLFPEDVSLICFMSFTKKKHTGFTKEAIIELLTSHFAKSRKLCYYLIPIILEILKDVRLANKILNHANFDELRNRGKVWLSLDVDFGLHFFRNKIQELQAAGEAVDSSTKKKGKLMKITQNLNKIRKFEHTLCRMYRKLFGSLILEEKKDIPLMLDTIEALHSNCENVYQKILKVQISGFTYRKFSSYLKKFRNDTSLAGFYRTPADIIDPKGKFKSLGSLTTEKTRNFRKMIHLTSQKKIFEGRTSSGKFEVSSEAEVENMSEEEEEEVNVVSVSSTEEPFVIQRTTSECDSRESSTGPVLDGRDSDPDIAISSAEYKKDGPSPDGSAGNIAPKQITTTFTVNNPSEESRSSKSNSVNKLRKKISLKKFLSTYCFDIGIVLLGVVLLIQIITMLVFSIVVGFRFEEVIAGYGGVSLPLRLSTVQIPQGIQMYHQSVFSGNETLSGVYRDLTIATCESTLNGTRELFVISDSKRRSLLTSTTIDLFSGENEKKTQRYNYIDAFTTMSEKCLVLMEKCTSKECDQNDRNYQWIMRNQYNLTKMGNDLITDIITSLQTDSIYSFVKWGYLIIPLLTLVCALFFVLFWAVYIYQQKGEAKMLNVLSQSNLVRLLKRFGGDENDVSASVKIEYSRIRVITQFLIIVFVLLVVFFSVFLSIGVIGHGVLPDSIEALESLRKYFDPQTDVQLIDFYAHELAYLEISPFGEAEIVTRIEENLELLSEAMVYVQYGFLSTISQNSTDVIFQDSCGNNNETTNQTYYEHLNCIPMSKQFFLISECTNTILEIHRGGSSNTKKQQLIRNSRELKTLKLLDVGDVETNGNFPQFDGPMSTKIYQLITLGMEYYIQFFSLILDIILVSYSTVIPVGAFIFLYMLVKFRGVLRRILRLPRLILLLMGRDELQKGQVFDFMTSRLGNKEMRKLEREKNLGMFHECLRNSSYPVLTFDKNLHITYSNSSAKNLLDIHVAYNNNIEKLFSGELVAEIKEWMMKRKSRREEEDEEEESADCLRSEGEATYGEFTFEITIDISRNLACDSFVAIVENVMTSKKKQILEVAEKRSKESDMLLRNILPDAYVKDLKLNKKSYFKMDVHAKMSAIFCDLCDFAGFFETTKMKAVAIMKLLHGLFSGMDDLSKQFGVEKIKTIGDCYFAVVGIPKYRPNHPKLAMDYCIEVLKFIREYSKEKKCDFSVRIGIASGSCVAGIISKWKWQFDCWGKTINLASRLEQTGSPGKIHISRSTYEQVFESYDFVERSINIKGVGSNEKTYLFSPDFLTPVPTPECTPRNSIDGGENEGQTLIYKEIIERNEVDDRETIIEVIEKEKIVSPKRSRTLKVMKKRVKK